MSLFERVSHGLYFFSVPPLQAGDLTGQHEDEGALLAGRRCLHWNRPGLGGPESFDTSSQVGVVVEERVGDVDLTLDGLACDRASQ
ncbi:hypothetical protein [Streptomyces subrutilus]|uniref:hypothetical protein n=1 Tax=Streptomyces subrutilus TaxID=36818 RepID=UPI00340B7FDD